MERDQDKFYTDEDLEQEEEVREADRSDSQIDDMNDMKYFIVLLKSLRQLIEHGGKVPLTNKLVIDGEKCIMILDDLEANLPDAVQYGLKMYNERSRIMGEATENAVNRVSSAEMKANATLDKARKQADQMIVEAEDEANRIVDDAQERADHMVEEDEIVRRAEDEARKIKTDARVEANEVRMKANHDAFQMLSEVEERLNEASKNIRKLRSELGETEE